MNCDQTRDLLSAGVDGQLDPAECIQLEEHLAGCEKCRNAAENLQVLDADLRRVFQPSRAAASRVADQVIAAIATAKSRAHAAPETHWPNWALVGVGMALGFLLASLLYSPFKPRPVASVLSGAPRAGSANGPAAPKAVAARPSVAKLIVATALQGLEFSDSARGPWQSVAAAKQFQCPTEGSIRTSDSVRCEIMTTDGCVVRMNGGTEIEFHSSKKVELKRGEIWCRSTPQAPLEVLPSLSAAVVKHAPQSDVTSVFRCTASDAACLVSVLNSGKKARVTAEPGTGAISVQSRSETLQLEPSETAVISRERVDREPSPDGLLAAAWMVPLLIRKGHTDPELAQRVDDLLAQIGQAKLSTLYESEIRSLGEYCVLPLLRYVASPRSLSDANRRRVAMQIASDLAPSWAIGDLVGLLKHSDAEVRVMSATALQRLTGQNQGILADAWRGKSATWGSAADAWQTWWLAHRDEYLKPFDTPQLPASAPQQREGPTLKVRRPMNTTSG